MSNGGSSGYGRSLRLIVGLPTSSLLLLSVGLLLRRSSAAQSTIEPAVAMVIGLLSVAAAFVLIGFAFLIRRPLASDADLVWTWIGMGLLVGLSLLLSAGAAYITVILGPLNPML
jgi:hypothetical protein